MSSNNGHNNNHTSSAERVYAEALLQIAAEAGQLQAVKDELDQFNDLLAAEPGAMKLFASKVLSADEREQSLQRIFKGRLSDLLYRFLQVLNQKDRLGDLLGILRAFDALYEEREGIVEVDAYVAQRMTDTEASAVAERIGTSLGRRVVLHQYVDPELIGGLKIRIGDQVIDGSASAQLRILKEKMIETGLEKARINAAKL
jgi:F-type H+-transporting ATPase subunit delta